MGTAGRLKNIQRVDSEPNPEAKTLQKHAVCPLLRLRDWKDGSNIARARDSCKRDPRCFQGVPPPTPSAREPALGFPNASTASQSLITRDNPITPQAGRPILRALCEGWVS